MISPKFTQAFFSFFSKRCKSQKLNLEIAQGVLAELDTDFFRLHSLKLELLLIKNQAEFEAILIETIDAGATALMFAKTISRDKESEFIKLANLSVNLIPKNRFSLELARCLFIDDVYQHILDAKIDADVLTLRRKHLDKQLSLLRNPLRIV